jgi:hypothetical protein
MAREAKTNTNTNLLFRGLIMADWVETACDMVQWVMIIFVALPDHLTKPKPYEKKHLLQHYAGHYFLLQQRNHGATI